jgi:ferredoxin
MSAAIFYYTGTGNSLWVARGLAEVLDPCELLWMPGCADVARTLDADTFGLVFPVYIWGVPAPVIRFVRSLSGIRTGYMFAVAVNGGQVSNTLVQLREVMARCGLELSSGFEIKMPSNYIPWGGPGPRDEQDRRFRSAREKISRMADTIRRKDRLPVEMGPLWQRIVFTAIYKMSFPRVPRMDRGFWVDGKCNACGICAKVCPAGNISMSEGRPVWNHRCDQCFACLQWCPQEAVQYGKKTPEYERYHHPEILLRDILRERSRQGPEPE